MKIRKTCEFCSKTFYAKRLSTRYCSSNCNSKHYKQKKREENISVSNTKTLHISNNITPDLLNKPYLSILETCIILGISRSSVMRMLKSDKLESHKIGGKRIIKRDDLDNLFKSFEFVEIPDEAIKVKSDYNIDNCYYIGEIQNDYHISSSHLNKLLNQKKVEKIQIGKHKYVLKKEIHQILGTPKNKQL
ncbi:helix-turn-helix domain-containing protein [Flavicella sediminum]|uniref:helix-turn-helix domain-containing protein n=1 Tax=Flavicella sediminum TaxID=2585141 RepID=UPI0011241088|nr:helix-turn-helix domain-containing protein [Flavicella sediminum]